MYKIDESTCEIFSINAQISNHILHILLNVIYRGLKRSGEILKETDGSVSAVLFLSEKLQ